MLLELHDKLLKQLRRGEQPEAFMSAWRFLHQLLRSYYIEKLDGVSDIECRKREAMKVNKAKEAALFGEFGATFGQVRLDERLKREAPALWRQYQSAAREWRHYMAHGKVFAPGGVRDCCLEDLTKVLLSVVGHLDRVFADDPVYCGVREGRPLSPLTDIAYDPASGKVTITLEPGLDPPDC